MDGHSDIYERLRLYDEVWQAPMREVAKRYGVSGVALAKTCRKLPVPVPGRGYWAKLAVGKTDPRPALPALPAGVPDRRVAHPAPPRAPLPPPLPGLEKAVPITVAEPIVVAETLEHPHRLVVLSARYLQKAKPHEGLVTAPQEHLPRHRGLALVAEPCPAHRRRSAFGPRGGRSVGRGHCA